MQAGRAKRDTLAGWCSVFHQSTENFTIGTLTKPTTAKIDVARAALTIINRFP